jgi:hypothetical protein
MAKCAVAENGSNCIFFQGSPKLRMMLSGRLRSIVIVSLGT